MASKIFTFFSTALLPVLNLAVFKTLTLYLANSDEFDVGYAPLLRLYAEFSVPAILILTAIGCLLGGKPRQLYLSLVFALGFLMWCQGAFLMWDYGLLDGREIDWESFGVAGWLDLALWIVVLVGALSFSRRLA